MLEWEQKPDGVWWKIVSPRLIEAAIWFSPRYQQWEWIVWQRITIKEYLHRVRDGMRETLEESKTDADKWLAENFSEAR